MARRSTAMQEAEIEQLESLNRARALTREESDRLYLLLHRQRIRACSQVARDRAKRIAAREIEARAA